MRPPGRERLCTPSGGTERGRSCSRGRFDFELDYDHDLDCDHELDLDHELDRDRELELELELDRFWHALPFVIFDLPLARPQGVRRSKMTNDSALLPFQRLDVY